MAEGTGRGGIPNLPSLSKIKPWDAHLVPLVSSRIRGNRMRCQNVIRRIHHPIRSHGSQIIYFGLRFVGNAINEIMVPRIFGDEFHMRLPIGFPSRLHDERVQTVKWVRVGTVFGRIKVQGRLEHGKFSPGRGVLCRFSRATRSPHRKGYCKEQNWTHDEGEHKGRMQGLTRRSFANGDRHRRGALLWLHNANGCQADMATATQSSYQCHYPPKPPNPTPA